MPLPPHGKELDVTGEDLVGPEAPTPKVMPPPQTARAPQLTASEPVAPRKPAASSEVEPPAAAASAATASARARREAAKNAPHVSLSVPARRAESLRAESLPAAAVSAEAERALTELNILPLSYALSLLLQLLPLPIQVLDRTGAYLTKSDADMSWDVLQCDEAFRKELVAQVLTERITLFTLERPVLLGGVALAGDLVLIVGPVAMRAVDSNFCKLYAVRHQASNVVLPTVPAPKVAALLLLIHGTLTGEKIALTTFLDRFFLHEGLVDDALKRAAEIYLDESLKLRPHNPISFEHDIIAAVKQGDVSALEKALSSPYASMRGILSSDHLRAQKNLAIVDITLVSRALIDTGYSAEAIFVLTDAFIRKVDECKDPEEAKAIARACAIRCTELRAEERQKERAGTGIKSPLVLQACDYMERHVYAKLDVRAIAAELKVSVGYLSKIFKREQHCTMSDYMRNKKIEIACMMLTNTDQSIDEIALALSFCSQSHFGALFSKVKGCSPSIYRKLSRLKRSSSTAPA